jgi:hypothetical protein
MRPTVLPGMARARGRLAAQRTAAHGPACEVGEASDSGGGTVGFGPTLSGRVREAVSGRRCSDRPGRDAGL